MELLNLIGLLMEYYNKTLSERALDVYLESLRDVPLEFVEEAVKEWINTSPWMPKVSELRALMVKRNEHYFYVQSLKKGVYWQEEDEGEEEEDLE